MQWCIGSSPVPRASPVRTGRGDSVYLVYNPLTEEDIPDLVALITRGVDVENGLLWDFLQWDGSMFPGGFPGNLEEFEDQGRSPADLLSTPF